MMDGDQVQVQIQRIINEDPTISEAKHIVVTVERKGLLRREVVYLKGKVHSDSERTKAERVAQLHAGGREVVDDIEVVH